MIPSAMVIAAVCGGLPPTFGAQVQRDTTQPSTRVIPVGTSSITGTVVDAESGRPVSGARVTVTGEAPQINAGRASGAASGRSGGPIQVGVTMTLGPVTQMSGNRVGRSVIADAQGAFDVRHLPAGRYLVNVSHRGYLNGGVGQRKPAGQVTAFVVADGERAAVTVKMIRGGVVTGTVYGEHGEPIANAQVSVYRYTNMMGARRLQPTGGVSTDDRGVYRVHSLQPGEYFVAATHNEFYGQDNSQAEVALIEQAIAAGTVKPPAAPGLPATVTVPIVTSPNPGPFTQPPGYVPTFFPSATSAAAAQAVRVVGGDVHANVDINVRLITASNIEGVITNPPGADMRVQIQAMSDDPNSVSRGGAQVRPDGSFFIHNLSPGTYTISAATMPVRAGQSGPPTEADLASSLWGRTTVTVSGESRVVTSLTLQAGRTIAGRVVFDMARPPDLTQQTVTVRLSQAPGSTMFGGQQMSARVAPDGTFTIRGVAAGRYIVNLNGPYTRSAILNGQDVLDMPLEFDGNEDVHNLVITTTDQVSELTGTFTPAEGASITDVTVLVVPTDERYWLPGSRRLVTGSLNSAGVYRIRGLPAGSYFIAVLTDFEQGTQYDQAFLKELMTTPGVSVTIGDGEKVTRDLRAAIR
jgi:hypothetical protein